MWQYFTVLPTGVRSVGVQGDARTYAHPIVVRAVTSDDAMTADWARIPYDVLAQLPAQVAEVTLERVHAEPTGEDWRLTFLGGALSWHWSSERHPDWRRVVPVKCNPTSAAHGGAPQFDPSLLAAMLKAVHTLGVKKSVALPFALATNADAGALVTCPLYPEFIGVVMPMRLKEKPVDVSPSWVRDTGEENDFA